MRKIKVNYIVKSSDGWSITRKPYVQSVEAIDGLPISEKEKEKAINQVLYPDGGINWTAWQEGQEDYNIAVIR